MNGLALAQIVALAANTFPMPAMRSTDNTPNFGVAEPVLPKAGNVGRNSPCPCGSGKKHKKCCRERVRIWQGPILPIKETTETTVS